MADFHKCSPPFLSEIRLESSSENISFSDPCPCCGNKKRRSLHPPSGSRKKLLVLESPNLGPLPTSSPPSPVATATAAAAVPLRRSDSSPLPTSSPSLTPPRSQSLSPLFYRSASFPSSAEVFQSPPQPPRASLERKPIESMSPSKPTRASALGCASGGRPLERSGSSAMAEPRGDQKDASGLTDEPKKACQEILANEGESVGGGQRQEEFRFSMSCRCGFVREIIIHNPELKTSKNC